MTCQLVQLSTESAKLVQMATVSVEVGDLLLSESKLEHNAERTCDDLWICDLEDV